jgi:hypothetical protein
MSAHTPTPWKLYHEGGILSVYHETLDDVIHWTGFDSAVCKDSRGTTVKTKNDAANAAFIVEAVNNHEKLLARVSRLEAALSELLEQIDCLNDIEYCRDLEPYKAEAVWNGALDTAREALKEQP